MIQRASVQPKPLRLVTPHLVNRPLQKPPSQSPADESRHQAELDQLDLIPLATIQLGKARRRSIDVQDVQLVPVLPTPDGKGKKEERMASPVITRPLWVDGKWHPAVIVLNRVLPAGFKVRLEGKRAMAGGGDVSRDIPLAQIADASLDGLEPLRKKPDALTALVEHLTNELKWRKL